MNISRDTLGYHDRLLIEDILKKDLSSLSPEDIAVLKARSVYLTPVEQSFYSNLLSGKVEPETVEEKPQEIALEDMKQKDLLVLAKSKGITQTFGLTKGVLISLIREAK